MKKQVLIIALILIGIFTYYYLTADVSSATKISTQDNKHELIVADADRNNDIKMSAVQMPEASNTVHADAIQLAFQFRQTRNLRAFITVAKAKASEGGLFLVRSALVECLRSPLNKEMQTSPTLKYSPTESHALASEKQKALLFLQERCSGFSKGEVMAELEAMKNDPNAAQDPLLMLGQKINSAKNEEQNKVIAAVVFQSGNPLLIERWGMSSALSMSMNGGRVPNDKDNNIYGLAWRLVGCDLGLRCDEQDIELQSSCYYFDICEKNKMDVIKKMTSVDSENHIEFNEVLQMKERILSALKEKRTDAFFR